MYVLSLVLLIALGYVRSRCPAGSVQGLSEVDCYFYHVAATWHTAEEKCITLGGCMVSIHYVVDNAFLVDRTWPCGSTCFYWTGGWGGNGQWQWNDGSNFSLSLWDNGEPSNGGCIGLRISSGKWISKDCFANAAFICKLPPLAPNVAHCPTARPASPRCESGWTYFDGSDACYKVFHDANQTWEFANERCVSHGAHLASIHGAAEQQFIQEISATGVKMDYSWPTYCGNGVWIGLNDVDEIGFYKWSDGTPYDYSNWGPGRPLDRGREYSYAMYYPDYFADSSLSNIFNTWDNVPNTYLARASVCKKGAAG